MKELLTSQVAYNLVIQFRRQAAALAKLPPRRLSFQRIWTTFRVLLLSSMTNAPASDPVHCGEPYQLALHDAQRDKLPNREGRHYEREAYEKCDKATHFKTRNPPRDLPTEKCKVSALRRSSCRSLGGLSGKSLPKTQTPPGQGVPVALWHP